MYHNRNVRRNICEWASKTQNYIHFLNCLSSHPPLVSIKSPDLSPTNEAVVAINIQRKFVSHPTAITNAYPSTGSSRLSTHPSYYLFAPQFASHHHSPHDAQCACDHSHTSH